MGWQLYRLVASQMLNHVKHSSQTSASVSGNLRHAYRQLFYRRLPRRYASRNDAWLIRTDLSVFSPLYFACPHTQKFLFH